MFKNFSVTVVEIFLDLAAAKSAILSLIFEENGFEL